MTSRTPSNLDRFILSGVAGLDEEAAVIAMLPERGGPDI
jgi:hypothetical protein